MFSLTLGPGDRRRGWLLGRRLCAVLVRPHVDLGHDERPSISRMAISSCLGMYVGFVDVEAHGRRARQPSVPLAALVLRDARQSCALLFALIRPRHCAGPIAGADPRQPSGSRCCFRYSAFWYFGRQLPERLPDTLVGGNPAVSGAIPHRILPPCSPASWRSSSRRGPATCCSPARRSGSRMLAGLGRTEPRPELMGIRPERHAGDRLGRLAGGRDRHPRAALIATFFYVLAPGPARRSRSSLS